MADDYQRNLSLQSPILLDYAHKQAKVRKMLAILADAGCIGAEPRGLAVDVGCSRGFFTEPLVPHFRQVVGVDIDEHALRIAVAERAGQAGATYLIGDSMRLPFEDASVDLLVCNHVYEHVPDAQRLFDEIHRVLSPAGACYLGAASRLIVTEPHYHLPFLSWLPRPLAHRYMRITGKGEYYYEKLRTYGGLMRLLGRFDVLDYTLRVLEDPAAFAATDVIRPGSVVSKVPMPLWRLAYRLLPTYLLILKKR